MVGEYCGLPYCVKSFSASKAVTETTATSTSGSTHRRGFGSRRRPAATGREHRTGARRCAPGDC